MPKGSPVSSMKTAYVIGAGMRRMNSTVKKVDDVIIEKNVPIQKSFRSPGKWQKVLMAMEMNDSFVLDETDDESFKQMNAIRAAGLSLGIKVKGIKENENSRRVYRVE